MPDSPNFANVPPKEAVDWFGAKRLRPAFDYREVWAEEHASAFTVAKAMRLDLLADLKTAVGDALAEGKTLAEFRKELTPTLQAHGWWGKQLRTDPVTGKVRAVQLGSPHRLRTIYRTNMRTARAAGQWQRIERRAESHPYLLYQLGPSKEHRVEHEGYAGLVLPVTDPWWDTHYPPNGWGCKCRVRQVNERERERLQKTRGAQTTAPPMRTREYVNKRTGQVMAVPEGIDPGWDYNPGKHGRLNKGLEVVTERLVASGVDAGAAVATTRQLAGGALPQWLRSSSSTDADFPLAVLPKVEREAIGAKHGLVRFSAWSREKQRNNHPELTAGDYSHVQQTIDSGTRINGNKPLHYIYHTTDEQGYVSVLKVTGDGEEIFLQSFRRLSADEARRDKEIARLTSRQIVKKPTK